MNATVSQTTTKKIAYVARSTHRWNCCWMSVALASIQLRFTQSSDQFSLERNSTEKQFRQKIQCRRRHIEWSASIHYSLLWLCCFAWGNYASQWQRVFVVIDSRSTSSFAVNRFVIYRKNVKNEKSVDGSIGIGKHWQVAAFYTMWVESQRKKWQNLCALRPRTAEFK